MKPMHALGLRAACASVLGLSAACGSQAQRPVAMSDTGSGTARSQHGADHAQATVTADCEAATWGEPGSLYQQWVAATATHPNLPDVSYAGYRGGEPLPSEAGRPRISASDFGAVANSGVDASNAVASAIAAVSAEGGVVVFPEGDFHFSRPVAIQHSGVVLRGAGKGRTRFIFERSLTDGYGENIRENGDSLWSWSGGLVWFSPVGKRAFPAQREAMGEAWSEGWTVGERSVPVLTAAERGDRGLRVGADHGLSVGQRVLIVVDTSEALLKHLAGDGAFAEAQDWSLARAGWLLPPQRPTIGWPAVLSRVDPESIALRQPLRFDLRAEWSPRIVPLGPVIEESGLVGVSLVMQREVAWTRAQHHLEVGWNGLYFENAWNCYAADIEVVDAENAVLMSASKHITVRDFTVVASSEALSPHHHGTVTRRESNDVLFEDFTIKAQPLHGINVESFSMGNVWSRGTLEHGTWDLHRALPVDNVITDMTIHNDGGAGGRADAGPRLGARNAVWNVEVENTTCTATLANAAIFPNGAIIGLRGCDPGDPDGSDAVVIGSGRIGNVPTPDNLYEAQRAVRRCREASR